MQLYNNSANATYTHTYTNCRKICFKKMLGLLFSGMDGEKVGFNFGFHLKASRVFTSDVWREWVTQFCGEVESAVPVGLWVESKPLSQFACSWLSWHSLPCCPPQRRRSRLKRPRMWSRSWSSSSPVRYLRTLSCRTIGGTSKPWHWTERSLTSL